MRYVHSIFFQNFCSQIASGKMFESCTFWVICVATTSASNAKKCSWSVLKQFRPFWCGIKAKRLCSPMMLNITRFNKKYSRGLENDFLF
jgi:hypothetical protein